MQSGRKRSTRDSARRDTGGRKKGAQRRGPSKRPLAPARNSSAREERPLEGGIRLNKYLADHGIASRRGCDELIESGKVSVDDIPVTRLGTRIDPRVQTIEVDGMRLRPEKVSRRYYLLFKPAGVVCTSEARETRPRAVDLIGDPAKGRIYTVGRLDEESKGLILLTNDGDFAQRVAHPRFGVAKTYQVKVQGRIDDEALRRVREGVHLSEGKTSGARILVQRRSFSHSTLTVTLREGMNREIRRSFARVGFKVVDLVRTRIGPLNDRGLKPGRWRPLTREEVEALLEGSSEERARQPLHEPRGGEARQKIEDGPRTAQPRRAGAGGNRRGGGARPKVEAGPWTAQPRRTGAGGNRRGREARPKIEDGPRTAQRRRTGAGGTRKKGRR